MADPLCPANCESPLPVISSADCDPETNLSEIEWLLMARPNATPIANVGSLVEWQSRIDNADTTNPNAIRQLSVTGDMPLPTDSEVAISRKRTVVLDRTFVINADADETSDVNYEAIRMWQCSSRARVWPVTRSGHVFGGSQGILVSVKAGLTLERGDTAIQKFPITLTWSSKFNPERHKWPLAGLNGGSSVSYDTELTFASSVNDTAADVEGTAPATNAVNKFEFQAIASPVGTPNAMTITVGGSSALTLAFPSDYAGRPFRYTHTTGATFTGTFTNGTVTF